MKRLLEHFDSPLRRLTEDFRSVKDDLAKARTGVDELVSSYNGTDLLPKFSVFNLFFADGIVPQMKAFRRSTTGSRHLSGNSKKKQQDTFGLKGRQDGLGYWLLETTEFKKWMSSTGEILWCCGERMTADLTGSAC